MKQISFLPTFGNWKKAARRALREGISPNEIAWEEIGEDQPGLHLFEEAETKAGVKPAPEFRVPKRFLALAKLVALHRQPTRWPLLYRLLWRLTHGESHLLEISIDPDVAMEELWRTYYANIFNPARVKVRAMQAEMPKKYWRNLPEATLIPSLLHEAPQRVESMMKKSAAKIAVQDGDEWRPAPAPKTSSLTTLREAAAHCTACPLYKNATQTVFGEGRKGAALMLLGEQPGDQEDLTGKPFIGPAGQLLNRALEEAGIDRDAVYVTNTVKHFKWEPRGKRRIHQKPSSRDIAACRPWLEAELRVVRPDVLVCLGSTASQAIFGSSFRVTKERGKVLESELTPRVVTTVHPSSLLRQPDEESRRREYALFVADLGVALRAAEEK